MDKFPELRPERESYVKHRRDVTRQILIPVILVTFVVMGLAALSIFAATGSHPGVSLWADIAAIWVIIPMMLLMLVILALTVASHTALYRHRPGLCAVVQCPGQHLGR
jgi:sterol desaturase/sphingolipid hydroxylase (fatty acid hydroxylase superfamily)